MRQSKPRVRSEYRIERDHLRWSRCRRVRQRKHSPEHHENSNDYARPKSDA